MGILEDWYFGKLNASEEIYPKNKKEYRNKLKEVEIIKQELKNEISETEIKKLEKLVEDLQKVSDMTSFENFRYGFSKGALLMLEICQCDGYIKSDLLNKLI